MFPATPLVATVELNLGGTWTNITDFVKVKNGITITRGRPDETSTTSPSSCKFTVRNQDGRFTPRNPTGPYYGLIGRNTPARVSVNLGATRLFTGTSASNYIGAPDTAALSIVGDLDLRADLRLQSWRAVVGIIGKTQVAPQRSYNLALQVGGTLALFWSEDGSTVLSASSTLPVPRSTGRQAVRATIDVDNGAGGHTITFYTAPIMAGTWTQLGNAVVQAGVTSIFDSTALALVGYGGGPEGYYYAAEIRQGIGGTVRANPDFTIQADGATSFVDGAGNTWTTIGAAAITNKRQRFIGEISSWPTLWGLDQVDVVASVEGAGLLRRLNQGDAPLRSAYYRAVTGLTSGLIAYWPMEDAAGSTSLAAVYSRTPYASPMYISGTPTLSSSTSFIASEALPVVGTSILTGYIGTPGSDINGAWEARALVAVPATGATDLAPLFRVFLASGQYADLVYGTGGTLGLNVYNNAGAEITSIPQTGFAINGTPCLVSLQSDGVSITIVRLLPGLDTANFTSTPTPYGAPRPTAVQVNPFGTLGAVGIGHVYVQRQVTTNSPIFQLKYALDAYAGDTAAARFARLCTEQGVPYVKVGDPSASETMGPQLLKTFLELVGDAVEVDPAILSEPRETASLGFRDHASIYNQDPSLALAYSSLKDLTPVDDDQQVRNDITVTRTGGSSARRELTTGTLSVAAPPAGVGVYDEQVEINLEKDSDLDNQAAYRLRLGTVDETRFPVLNLDLSTSSFAASASLTASALDLDQGDLMTVSGPPTWMAPDLIRQIAQGFTETFDLYSYDMAVNCTPASVWDVGTYNETGNTAARYSSSGSTLSAAATSTATSLSVATSSGPLWVTTAANPAEFPFDIVIAGERITVGACTGTSSPQTFSSLTRSVNGVVKAQPSGAVVELFKPAYFAL